MVKVTLRQVAGLIQEKKYNEKGLKRDLRYLFSLPENIDTFSQFLFPEHIIGEVQDFQRDFYKILNSPSNDALASFRGSAKSTCVGIIYISWCIVNKTERYIVYMSQNHTKTVQFIEPLRTEFNNNLRLIWLYGDLSPNQQDKNREDCVDINKIRIEAVSFEKNIRGFKYGNIRPTLIIGDDIDSDARVRNPTLREQDRNKLTKIVIPSLDINGRFKMIGTILHHDSLLSDRIKRYNGTIYTAYKDSDTRRIPIWSSRFTIEKLNRIRKDIGTSSFESEYMNNPVDNATSIIKTYMVENCLRADLGVEDLYFDELYLGVDFAFSDKVSADDSAFADVGVTFNSNGTIKNLILINAEWCHGLSNNNHWEKIQAKYSTNRHDMILLEENSIKGSVQDIKELDLPVKFYWTGSKDPNKYKQGNNTQSTTISKINSIQRLASTFESKKWIIPYKSEREQNIAMKLMSELTSWGLVNGKLEEFGVHPDMPIPLILANEYVRRN